MSTCTPSCIATTDSSVPQQKTNTKEGVISLNEEELSSSSAPAAGKASIADVKQEKQKEAKEVEDSLSTDKAEEEEEDALETILDAIPSSHQAIHPAPTVSKNSLQPKGYPTVSSDHHHPSHPAVSPLSFPVASSSWKNSLGKVFGRSSTMERGTRDEWEGKGSDAGTHSSSHGLGMISMFMSLRDASRMTSGALGSRSHRRELALSYEVKDLAEDAVHLLDALHISVAHVVGHSSGGTVAQVLALQYPHRVASLTLIGSHDDGPNIKRPSTLTLMRLLQCIRTPFPKWFLPSSGVFSPSSQREKFSALHEKEHLQLLEENQLDKEEKRMERREGHAFPSSLGSPSLATPHSHYERDSTMTAYRPEEEHVLHQHAAFIARVACALKDKKYAHRHPQPKATNEGEEEEEDEERYWYHTVLALLRRSGPLDYHGICRHITAFLCSPSRREMLQRTLTSNPDWAMPKARHLLFIEKENRGHEAERSTVTMESSPSSSPCSRPYGSSLGASPPFYIPTTIINGTNDPLSSVENAKSLSNAISGSRLVLIPGLSFLISPRSEELHDKIIEEIHHNVECYKKYAGELENSVGRRSHL